MDTGSWTSAGTLPDLYEELKQLDLIENIVELEAFGFTVVPPEKVGTDNDHRDAREALVDVACSRKKCREAELTTLFEDGQELLRFMIWDNPRFERILLNPAGLGLVQYLLGTNCLLSLCDGWIKGKGESRTGIHADWAQFEMQTFPPEPFTANFNYLLSDYSKSDGALSFVPRSHKWRRYPSAEEASYWNDRAHAVEAPMGSMVIWGDHTWHGSYARETDGLRLMMLATFCRPHMQTQEPFRSTVTQDALDRNPRRFGALMDVHGSFPFGKSPPRPDRKKLPPKAGPQYLSLFDTEPANGTVQLRTPVDFQHYDKELHDVQLSRSKGQTIRFPDVYRTRRDTRSD